MVSFLIFRLQTGAHWYVAALLARNVALSLTPILPDDLTQVMTTLAILLSSTVLSTAMLPWKGLLSNCLDVVVHLMMVSVMCIAAVSVKDANFDNLGVVVMVLLASGALAVLTAMAWGIYSRCLRRRKPYDYFLSHHKADAAALARLLKLMLLDDRTVKEIFID